MRVDKAAVVKELVDGVGRDRAHPEDGVKGVGTRAQMGDRTQILQRMALFLQRIIRRGDPLHRDFCSMDLEGLLGVRGEHHAAADRNGASNVEFTHLFEVFELALLEHDLQVLECRSVIQLDKAERLGIPDGLDPAADRDLAVDVVGNTGGKAPDFCPLHAECTLPYEFFRPVWTVLKPQI